MIPSKTGFRCLALLSLLPFLFSLAGCTSTPEKPQAELTTIERARIAYRNKDYGQTLILLNALVQKDNAEAQYALGYMYRYGQGLPRNQERASYWITLAAKNGCQKAQTALQLMRLKDESRNKTEDMSGSCTPEEEKK